MTKILVLASYCGNKKCSEIDPCKDCLASCNVFEVPSEVITWNQFIAEFCDLKRGLGRYPRA